MPDTSGRNDLGGLTSPQGPTAQERALNAQFGDSVFPLPPRPLADRTPPAGNPRAYLEPGQIVQRIDARQRGGVTR